MPATEMVESRLHHSVEEALAHTPGVNALNINVQVEGGLVTLTGAVDTLAEKLAAGQAAQDAPGVIMVENRLAVTTQGDLRETVIRQDLDRAAGEAGGLPGMTWDLDDGVVRVAGVTNSIASAHEAATRMAEVPGVKAVEHHLHVASGGLPQDDASLKSRVEEALHADADLDLLPIEVSVREGVVTLSGRVDDLAQRLRAQETAEAVPGVGHLVNQVIPETGETGGEPRLEQQIREALRHDPLVDERRVLVTVVDDIAFLGGEVRSVDDRVRAEAVAQGVPGIRSVVNDIQVVSEYSR